MLVLLLRVPPAAGVAAAGPVAAASSLRIQLKVCWQRASFYIHRRQQS